MKDSFLITSHGVKEVMLGIRSWSEDRGKSILISDVITWVYQIPSRVFRLLHYMWSSPFLSNVVTYILWPSVSQYCYTLFMPCLPNPTHEKTIDVHYIRNFSISCIINFIFRGSTDMQYIYDNTQNLKTVNLYNNITFIYKCFHHQ